MRKTNSRNRFTNTDINGDERLLAAIYKIKHTKKSLIEDFMVSGTEGVKLSLKSL